MCVCTMGLHSPARQRVEVVGSWTMHCEENLEYGFKSMRLDLVSWKDTKTWEMGITFWFSHLPWIQSKSSRWKEERSWIWEEQRRTICGFREKPQLAPRHKSPSPFLSLRVILDILISLQYPSPSFGLCYVEWISVDLKCYYAHQL